MNRLPNTSTYQRKNKFGILNDNKKLHIMSIQGRLIIQLIEHLK